MKHDGTFSDTRALRGFLVKQMEGIAKGEIDESTGRGIANVAQQVYNTLNIELKFARAVKEIGEDAVKPVKF